MDEHEIICDDIHIGARASPHDYGLRSPKDSGVYCNLQHGSGNTRVHCPDFVGTPPPTLTFIVPKKRLYRSGNMGEDTGVDTESFILLGLAHVAHQYYE